MVQVGHSGHRVDLEVLVGADRGCLLNWAPVGEAWLRIVEPLVAELAHVGGVQVGHTPSNFRARHSSVKIEHLWANLLHAVRCRLDAHELVPQYISGPDDLYIVDVIGIESRHCHSAPVHLSGKDLIAKQPVAENSTVRVGTVKAFGPSYIDKVAEQRVHGIVLLLDIIQMGAMLVDLITANHALQHQERVEILMLPARRIIEHSDRRVDHLVVANHEQTWIENCFL